MMFLNKGILSFSSINYLSILQDGNTAAWYASDEASTITKNASNGVSGWGDKLSYVEGPELIDQANWYKLSYWNSPDANWAQSGTSLHSSGSGSCNKTNFLQVGHSYKITITMSYTSGGGEIRPLNDNVHVNRLFGAVANGTFTWIVLAWNSTTLYNSTASGWIGYITAMSVKEVPVNTLTQYDLPNAYMPLWSATDGIAFDGTNDYMKTSPFTLNQPTKIYIVGKQVTWTISDYLFDGNATGSGKLSQDTTTPKLGIYAGSFVTGNADLPLNTYGIVKALFNGANSSLQINNNIALTGNTGAGNMGGFTLGSLGAGTGSFGRITAKEIIIRKAADNITNDTIIYNYLKTKYGL